MEPTMKKIILGYEQFNTNTLEGWNLNGRYGNRPLKKTYHSQGEFYDGVYRLLINPQEFPDNNKDSLPLFNSATSDFHVSLAVKDIPPDCQYFYPIIIRSLHFVTDLIDEFEISDRVRSDVLANRAHILFLYTQEGDLSYCRTKFYELVSKLCLPKQQILFLHGSQSTEKFCDAPFTYVPVNIFHWWLNHYRTTTEPTVYTGDKLFLLYNRQVRFHRLCMLAGLIQNQLLDRGIFSCGVFRFHDIESILKANGYDLNDHEFQILRGIELTSPDNEIANSDIINRPTQIHFDDYKKTFLSLVAETLSDDIFLSEKTYKPLAAGHPFILLAAPGQLAYLKTLGYQTFDQYWNEDYDKEHDLHARIKKIIDILKYLNSKSRQELVDMRQSMISILTHNQTLFRLSFGENNNIHDQTPIRDYLVNFINQNSYV